MADQASSAYRALARRDQANVGANARAVPKTEKSPADAPRSRFLPGVLVAGAVVALVVAGLTAASLSTSRPRQQAQSGLTPTAITAQGTDPAASQSVSPTSTAAAGQASLTASSVTGARQSPQPGTTLAAAIGAPSTAGSAPVADTPTAAPTGAGTATASASAYLVGLCRSVVTAGNSWPSVLKGTDRAAVIAAAGSKNNVLAYCTALIANTPAA